MFNTLKKLRRNWQEFMSYDPETAALNDAGDRIDVEMIQRRFARQNRRGPLGY